MPDTKVTTNNTANKTGKNETMDQKKSSLTPIPTSSAKDSTIEIIVVARL